MMTDKTVRGRFVWHELMTPDASAAHSFYSKTLGWKTQPSEQVPDYAMFVAPSGPLGGAVSLPAGAPHWLAYIGTPDIDATVAQARDLGAKVVKDVEELPGGVGKYAVLNDPQGAQFAVYTSAAEPGREKPPKRGEFSWHELKTTDAKAALEFYSALFGWEQRNAYDMGPLGFYYLFGRNGQELGGVFNKPAEEPGGPAWIGYVRVKDVHQVVKKVKAAGGTLLNDPMEVPGGDWIAQFVDPHGAAFAVHTLKADIAPADAASSAEDTASADEVAAEEAVAEEESAPTVTAEKTAKSGKAKKAPSAAKPAKKAAGKAAAKKSLPAAKQRAAAKGAKRPAGKTAKATKKVAGKAAKSGKNAKAAKAKSGAAKGVQLKGGQVKGSQLKASQTKGSQIKGSKSSGKSPKKPARKK